MQALTFALSRTPKSTFVHSKQALESKAKVTLALYEDAQRDNFPLLVRCADLLDLNGETGSGITESLTQIANKLMSRQNQEHLIATELASTKATVMVLAALPIVGVAMGLILGTHSIAWLFGTTAGKLCLVTGIGLEVIGWRWIQRLINRAMVDVT